MLLVLAKLGEDGYRQHFLRGPLRLRQIARLVSQIRKTLLQMQRQRVVDFGADLALAQEVSQFVALPGADDELVVDVVCFGRVFRSAIGDCWLTVVDSVCASPAAANRP